MKNLLIVIAFLLSITTTSYLVYERILSKDEKADDYIRSYIYNDNNYGSTLTRNGIDEYVFNIVDKKSFDGMFIYDIEKKIDNDEYKSEEGYDQLGAKYYKTIQRITIIFTGSEFQVLSIIEPWKWNRDKNKIEFIYYKNYNKN